MVWNSIDELTLKCIFLYIVSRRPALTVIIGVMGAMKTQLPMLCF